MQILVQLTSFVLQIENGSLQGDTSARVMILLPPLSGNAEAFYICVKNGSPNDPKSQFLHQGSEPWLRVKTYTTLVPLWASIVIILVCISFSSLFSGLNLGKSYVFVTNNKTKFFLLRSYVYGQDRLENPVQYWNGQRT